MKDKQWYVDQHRAMWNWIADTIQVLQYRCFVNGMKRHWCEENHQYASYSCFACEYVGNTDPVVCRKKCPFNWGECSGFTRCTDGYYAECRDSLDWKKQVELARKIANLPVREEV